MLATSATLLSVVIVLTGISISQACTNGEARLVDSEGQPAESKRGLLQVCQDSTWKTICKTKGWGLLNAANVACRALGYLEYGATVEETHSHDGSEVGKLSCDGQERTLLTCSFETRANCRSVLGHIIMQDDYTVLSCGEVVASCIAGEVRLTGGRRYGEGRVKVCVNGRWGTVCGRGWTDQQAGLVCRQLGYSTTGSALRQFGKGTGPIYTLDCQDDPKCVPTLSTQPDCTHAHDLGVVCSSFDESCHTAQCMQTNTGLGVLTALLTAALVAVVVGWIISCVWLQRRSKDHTQESDSSTHQLSLHNPVYDPGHLKHNHSHNATASPTTYSSQGPSYEAVGYDVINRNRSHSLTTPLVPHLTDQDYSTLDESRVEHDYHMLEPNTAGVSLWGVGQ